MRAVVNLIEEILKSLETGNLTRRQAAKRLAAIVFSIFGAGRAEAAAAKTSSLFQATGLNHFGLRVRDVARSRDFYQNVVGLTMIRDNAPNNCFLRCGDNFVGLFRSKEARLDHYCYTVDNYSVEDTIQKLSSSGIETRREENRVYFTDPDGFELQVSGKWDSWPGPAPATE